MKAAANGVLNLSILDGWWDEAYAPEVGWAIGRGETYSDHNYQDQVEAEALYDLLERDIVPMFYKRDASALPRVWIEHMKADISALCNFFNTNRMVAEYTERFYVPCAERYTELAADEMAGAKALAEWRRRIARAWKDVKVEEVEADLPEVPKVGDAIEARAWVELGELTPEDVRVELYLGRVDAEGHLTDDEAIPMTFVRSENGRELFEVTTTTKKSGLHGYTVRVLPHHPLLITSFLPGYITWAHR
jgi:starch phosphorylase